MGNEYEIPKFEDGDKNVWYLNTIAVSNFSSQLAIETGDTTTIFSGEEIVEFTSQNDYNYDMSQIEMSPAPIANLGDYYFIRYGWTTTPPENWGDGGSGEPQDTYQITYNFDLPANDMILYPIEYSKDLGENRINVDSDGGVTTVESKVTAMNTAIAEGLNFVVAGALASEYEGFLIFTKGENPTYYYLDGWKIGGTKYEMGKTVQASAELAGTSNTITVEPNWVKIEPLTVEERSEAEANVSVKVDPLIRDKGVAQDVLLTQWTSTDENTINGQKTANDVVLDETGIISYQVSAVVNHAGVTDADGMSYGSEFATFTFALDIDKQLEFANVADDETVTINFQSSVLQPTGTNIKNGNSEGATIGGSSSENWTITFNPANVPKNGDGSMHLEITVQWIAGTHTDGGVTRPLVFSGLDFKLKDTVTEKKDFELNTSVGVTGEMDLRNKIPDNLRAYYRVVRGQLTNSEDWQKQFGESYAPVAFVHALQFMDYKLADINMNTSENADNTTLEANEVTATYTAFTITATAGANGSISPTGETKVYKGDSQTFTITPSAGFEVADVLVDGQSVGARNTYTFTDVTKNHTISASFKPAFQEGRVTITPANITVYEGGDGGYDAVVGDTGTTTSNSLPHPMFRIDTPDGTDPADLTFRNGNKSWTVISDGNGYYHFSEGAGQDKVRVTYSYTDEAGVKHTVTEDAFDPATMGNVYGQLTIELYPGSNNLSNVTAITADGAIYRIDVRPGTLTVRAVESANPTSDIVDSAPDVRLESGTAVAVEPVGGTTYTLNDTGVELPRTPSPLCCSMRSSPRTGLIALLRWRTRLTRCWADLVAIASTRSGTWIWLTPITAMHGSPPAMASIFTGPIRKGQIGALTSRFSTSRACTGMARIPVSMLMTLNW